MSNEMDLMRAAKTVLDGLNARIDAAVEGGGPIPVFDGIADLHDAVGQAAPQAEQVAEQSVIAGALFDFIGFLTTRDSNTTLGATSPAAPAVDLLSEWAETRSLALDDADVSDWQSRISTAPPTPDVSGLVKALEACLDALWEDTREVKLDDTMMFGHGYDWDGWDSFRWELHTQKGSFAVWPAHGTYSAYGGLDGSYWNQCFSSAQEAKDAIVRYVAKIDPDHPASKAYAALAAHQNREG